MTLILQRKKEIEAKVIKEDARDRHAQGLINISVGTFNKAPGSPHFVAFSDEKHGFSLINMRKETPKPAPNLLALTVKQTKATSFQQRMQLKRPSNVSSFCGSNQGSNCGGKETGSAA
jgi:hypothetical protein